MPVFGFFKKKDWQATVNLHHQITVKAGENLLAAGLRAGLDWPHDCRVGSCGTCRCTLMKGKIKSLNDFSYALTPEQLKQGMVLACQTALKSDVDIEVELGEGNKVAVVTRKGTLATARKLTHDIMEVRINCDAPLPEGVLAGQYVEVSYEGLNRPRSYSFARAPEIEPEGEITLYIRLVPNGEFTEWLFAGNREGVSVSVVGPYGNFWLRDSKLPMVCIAGGSGMSAVKAVLEHASLHKIQRDAIFLFGARTQADIYCREEMEHIRSGWHQDYKFEFEYVLSNEPEGSGWEGPRGFVTDHLRSHYIEPGLLDISACQAYMCGPPPMIDAGIEALTLAGLDEAAIFYDKFLDSSTMPKGR